MFKLVYTETSKISKTELILAAIAQQAPVSEYDLYKHFPKYSHGTIHFCLEKLAKEGAITYTKTKTNNRPTKRYHLTIIGTLSIMADTILNPSLTFRFTNSDIVKHDKEIDDDAFIEFMCTQGELLDYDLFKESKWLADRYPKIAETLALFAARVCDNPPLPIKNVAQFIIAHGSKDSWKTNAGSDYEWQNDPLFDRLQDAYKMEFTKVFFEQIPFLEHNDKSTTNRRLQRLAEDLIEERKREMAALKQTSQLFQ